METRYNREHTDEAIDQRGEVFTPILLVNEILDKLPKELFTNKTKTYLDNSCGNGNFLIEILNRKMANGSSHTEALSTIYGVDIDAINIKECKERLSLGKKNKEVWSILDRNIICADALDRDHKGWKKVGYMWNEDEKPAGSEDFAENTKDSHFIESIIEKYKIIYDLFRDETLIGGKEIYEGEKTIIIDGINLENAKMKAKKKIRMLYPDLHFTIKSVKKDS